MNQLSLFGLPPQESQALAAQALSHRSDPESSRIAAAELVASGAHANQSERVYQALCEWERVGGAFPHPTSAELAARMEVDRVMPARRLPDLEKLGRVEKVPGPGGKPLMRKCGVQHSMACVWRIVR